jgi:hypothetical protein
MCTSLQLIFVSQIKEKKHNIKVLTVKKGSRDWQNIKIDSTYGDDWMTVNAPDNLASIALIPPSPTYTLRLPINWAHALPRYIRHPGSSTRDGSNAGDSPNPKKHIFKNCIGFFFFFFNLIYYFKIYFYQLYIYLD